MKFILIGKKCRRTFITRWSPVCRSSACESSQEDLKSFTEAKFWVTSLVTLPLLFTALYLVLIPTHFICKVKAYIPLCRTYTHVFFIALVWLWNLHRGCFWSCGEQEHQSLSREGVYGWSNAWQVRRGKAGTGSGTLSVHLKRSPQILLCVFSFHSCYRCSTDAGKMSKPGWPGSPWRGQLLWFPVEEPFHHQSAACWPGGAGQLVLWIRPPQSRDRLLPNTRVSPSLLTSHTSHSDCLGRIFHEMSLKSVNKENPDPKFMLCVSAGITKKMTKWLKLHFSCYKLINITDSKDFICSFFSPMTPHTINKSHGNEIKCICVPNRLHQISFMCLVSTFFINGTMKIIIPKHMKFV